MNTPGVYVKEVATLPPSVAQVATAIPAFIGRTANGTTGTVKIEKIISLVEYEHAFGGPTPTAFEMNKTEIAKPESNVPDALLWYALNHYFSNGGGLCFVVSVAGDKDKLTTKDIEAGIEALVALDDPTLVLIPEAVTLAVDDYATACQKMLAHCQKTKDRFAILDVREAEATGEPSQDAIEQFRTKIGADNLNYGAAYYPYIMTTLTHAYDEKTVKVAGFGDANTLSALKDKDTVAYNEIKRRLGLVRVTLPPSAAVAGVYARVDRERGVWKAPANVSLLSVIGPTKAITNDQQERLNVDSTGKSVNAIRSFVGKGTLIWGARTLAGNDNEWRFINVRRLFITIEESAKDATAFAVFEANDSSTWLKVKGMLESYLYGLWEQGALQGATAEQAFYVHVGLGKTMTPQDILEGKMIVVLGIAAVRPAEFIELRFSHKLPEA